MAQKSPAKSPSKKLEPHALEFASPSKAQNAGQFKIHCLFRCPASNIVSALTEARDIMYYTHSKATSEPKSGGRFSWFDDAIYGVYTTVEPHHIVMKWKFSTWRKQDYADIDIELSEPEPKCCEVRLVAKNIPFADGYGNHGVLETTEQGWSERVFGNIAKFIGYPYERLD